MSRKFYWIPRAWEKNLEHLLEIKCGISLTDSRQIAEAIVRMSDFYIASPTAQTPWSERWAQIAQLSYYFPLNLLRWQATFSEYLRLSSSLDFQSHCDFGAGLSPTRAALMDLEFKAPSSFVERSRAATDLAKSLNHDFKLEDRPMAQGAQSLLTLSYSLTELADIPKWLFDFETVMIVEPSTREDGRRLMKLRENFLERGFQVWAPCTHQQSCPLLPLAGDWCHHRIHLSRPEWWIAIEKYLPFENPTVTFSYLIASKKPRTQAPDLPNKEARLVSDLLREKGKSRQLVCRGPEREFLAWMNRDGEPQELPRGELVFLPDDLNPVANELRVKSPVQSHRARKN